MIADFYLTDSTKKLGFAGAAISEKDQTFTQIQPADCGLLKSISCLAALAWMEIYARTTNTPGSR